MSNIIKPAIDKALRDSGYGHIAVDPYYAEVVTEVAARLEERLAAAQHVVYRAAIAHGVNPRDAHLALVQAGLASDSDDILVSEDIRVSDSIFDSEDTHVVTEEDTPVYDELASAPEVKAEKPRSFLSRLFSGN
jgi:hypothetical protein